MIALKLTQIKMFMGQLLKSELFDSYLMPEATLAQNSTIVIDGHINDSYYTEEERIEQHLTGLTILPFSKLRPLCLQLIAGKKTPSYFKFSFQLALPDMEVLLAQSASGFTSNDISGIFFHLTFRNGELVLTNGISYRSFAPIHTLDEEWDREIQKILRNNGVIFEEM